MRLLQAAVIVAALGVASPASAGQLEILFDNGRVTVRATDVTLRQILQEWARQGQTRIAGLEKLAGAPVTIELVDLPERQAIEILLRSVAGYMAAPRLAASGPTQSSYDRLMILATSVAAPAPVGGPRSTAFAPPPQPQPFPDPIQLANGDDGPAEMTPPPGAPAFGPPTDPAAGPAGPMMPGGQLRPQMPGDSGPVPGTNDAAAPPQGPLTAPRPGILPVPQQPQQPRP
jgi:hypothetical protein